MIKNVLSFMSLIMLLGHGTFFAAAYFTVNPTVAASTMSRFQALVKVAEIEWEKLRARTKEKPTIAERCVLRLRTTNPKNVFTCPKCPKKSFARKDCLTRHCLIIHNQEKRFKCQHCSKRFGLKHRLITHVRIHTGEKPFTCIKCGHKFADLSNWHKHQKTSCNKMRKKRKKYE